MNTGPLPDDGAQRVVASPGASNNGSMLNLAMSFLSAFGGLVGRPSSSSMPSASERCDASWFTPNLSPGATIEAASVVAAGGSYGEGAPNVAYPGLASGLPASCALTVRVASSPTSSFRFGLFLPSEAAWNSRFLAVGNGAFAGGINWVDMGAGTTGYGFAAMSTDTGHNSTGFDLGWALGNPEAVTDFGYRAMHGSVETAKALVERYYGKPIDRSYYSGCSTGGRQGLKEAQLHPDSFDGVLVGAPAWWSSHLATWTARVGTLNLPASDPKHIPPPLFAVIAAEAVRQCDAADGVRDGIVSAPDKCAVDLSTLLCKGAGSDSTTCLTAAQVATARSLYADYVAAGRFAFPGLSVGSEAQWAMILAGTEPSPLGTEYIRNMVLSDPTWDWRTDFNDSVVWLADAADPGNQTAGDFAALAGVRDRGGKILMYHGLADGGIPAGSSKYFYEHASDAVSGADDGGFDKTAEFFRLFLVPGMQHCAGSVVDAPWYFGGAGQAGQLVGGGDGAMQSAKGDSGHDALLALMDWVEKGVAVDSVVATAWKAGAGGGGNNPAAGVSRQRPLCPYPKRAVLRPDGDANKAEAWECSLLS